MGQVWSKADFDGIREAGMRGGCGSTIAVTSQNLGSDGMLGTNDDLLAPLNRAPVSVSLDSRPGPNCRDDKDRIRGFYSFHPDGAYFLFGDGSVRWIAESIASHTYQGLSTIDGGEVATYE